MRTLKNRILVLICLLMVTSSYATVFAFTDNYPKNPKIDAINYTFKIELSDETDEIVCDLTIDVRFLGAGVKNLRLDLVNASQELNNKGMVVMQVVSAPPVPLRRLNPTLPGALEDLCMQCLDKLPKRRYATADHLAEAIKCP